MKVNPINATGGDSSCIMEVLLGKRPVLERLLLRISIELQGGCFPNRKQHLDGIFKRKLVLLGRLICGLSADEDLNRHLTMDHIADLKGIGHNNMILIDDLCRPDEISHAITRYTMGQSSLDEKPWYCSEEMLARVIIYMTDHIAPKILKDAMSSFNCFRNLYKKCEEVVLWRQKERLAEVKQMEKAKLSLADSDVLGSLLFYPYDKILSVLVREVCGVQPTAKATDLATLTLSMNKNTIHDGAPKVEDDEGTRQVWLMLCSTKILFAINCREDRPRNHAKTSIMLEALKNNSQVFKCPLISLLPLYTFLKCHRCEAFAGSRRNLLRHIERKHRKSKTSNAE